MRTEESWLRLREKYLHKFPLRLQKDLREIEVKDFGDLKNADSLFIFGEVNTGKTVLAAQLMLEELKSIYLNAEADKHNSTLFVSFSDMLFEIKNTFSNSEKTEEVMKKYLNAHLLVLDDFITSRPTDWVLELLYHLINHRYENMKRTIITCNFSLVELESILQEQRIISRISRSYLVVQKRKYNDPS